MSNEKISQWIRPDIQALSAYFVPDPGKLIKLDNMENPYLWDAEIIDAWVAELKAVAVNRYPDAQAAQLQKVLRESMGIPAGSDLLLGNGSDELIQMICLAMAKPGSKVFSVGPSFVMYRMLAIFAGMEYVSVDLNPDFSLNLQETLTVIKREQPAVIFLAYPNNPTGNLFGENEICQIIEVAPGLVVIDEAYHAFAGDSFVKHLDKYPNMIVMRTVSKMGLAGLRLGYMMGNPQWIAEFNKVRLPFNINSLTQSSAVFALEHKEMFDKQTNQLCKNREQLYAAMCEMKKIESFPSKANFILFRTQSGKANEIFDKIKQAGVLIKNLSPQGGLLQDCLRVTVGTESENAAFLNALKESLSHG